MNETDQEKLDRWLKEILTFKHLTKKEVKWYIKELSRRFNYPSDTLAKLFKQEGML